MNYPGAQALDALNGVRVVELSDGIAAAFCGKLFADYGADVIKIERPGTGSGVRRYGPFVDGQANLETGALHLYLDTCKRSVTLDLQTASGAALLRRFASSTDLVVSDCPQSALSELGLSFEVLHEINADLGMVGLSYFGESGPCSDWKGNNLTAMAMGGQMALTGDAGREPLKLGGFQADYQLGLNGFVAATTALLAAGRDRQGQYVEVSAMDVMVSTLDLMLPTYAYTGNDFWGGRRGNITSAAIGLYPARNGYIGIQAMPRNWPVLIQLMEKPELATDERFVTAQTRLQHDDDLLAIMYAWAAEQDIHELYARARRLNAPASYVHDMSELLASPQLAERLYFLEVDHPAAGKLIYPRGPFVLSETPWRSGRAPLLGEHNAAVFAGMLDYDRPDLECLHGNGVI